MYDLQQLVFANYVFGNIAGATVEDHTAKPDIVIERDILRTPITNNTNGAIRFVKARPGANIELGPSRHKKWLIMGYILHANTTIFDDATILAMKAEIESVLNVYNKTIGSYTHFFSVADGYNEDPVNAVYDFIIDTTEYGVTART